MAKRSTGWHQEFDDPIELSDGRKLIGYGTRRATSPRLPRKRRRSGVAGRDRGTDAGSRTRRADNIRADRDDAGAEPAQREGYASVPTETRSVVRMGNLG